MYDQLNSQAPIREPQSGRRKTVAVIGSGIAGLSAAWLLDQHADITVFESEAMPGGHSHTVNVRTDENPLWIDMGFIVFNEPCYPNLVQLFKYLDVEHQLSDMSFGVSVDKGALEYCSLGLNGLFAQRRNLFRPRFLSLLLDVMRFYREAPKDLAARARDNYRLGDYLKDRNYGRAFIDDHLLPQAAAIWSTSAAQIMDYPFRAFIAFFENHGLLQIMDRILWRSVKGGAQAYLKKLIATFADRIHSQTAIVGVRRDADGVTLTDQYGQTSRFDEVVFATHADVTLRMLSDATDDEKRTLGAFEYTPNEVVLHTDASFMPKRRAAWSSWNYLGEKDASDQQQLCVTYWMNLLQVLPKTEANYFVTLNPLRPVDPSRIIKQVTFEHPLFNAAAIAAQDGALQGQNHSWFCGAYFGSGFHEDGLQSGLAVAEAITGARRPWDFDWSQSRIRYNPWLVAKAAQEAS